jgi:tetratricopeptide (TPR) repeat protein
MIPRSFLHLALPFVLVLVVWLAYRPGLTGTFVFDDFANLPALGDGGPVDNAPAFARYVTSGTADPIGRPLAVLSFLIDAHDWPADPRPFKRTNVLLHILNGVLLYFLLNAIGREWSHRKPGASTEHRFRNAALISAFLWVLHPLLVSTTLYIVQREAILPATFSLLGILAWVRARRLLAQARGGAGAAMAMTAIVFCTLLAGLSKANGLLLPTLILVVDNILLPPFPANGGHAGRIHRISLTICWISTTVILFALGYLAWAGMFHGIPHRPWTEGQRLLTEPRILWEYLGQLWLPHPYTAGVFNDTTVVSVDLWTPWTTSIALAGLILLVTFAALSRGWWRAAAGAVVFFLAGHLLESTSVPLELYFEHRNYLPSLMLFWPAGLWLAGLPIDLTKTTAQPLFPSSIVRHMLAIVAIALLFAMTYANASVWGDTEHQATLWARLNPTSARAQVTAAQEELRQGQPSRAVTRLAPLLDKSPGEVQVAFNLVAAHCQLGDLSAKDVDSARRSLGLTRDPGSLISSWYARTIQAVAARQCPGLTFEDLKNLAEAGLANPRLSAGRKQDLEHALGALALARRDADTALVHFNRGLLLEPREPVALRQAAELGSAGHARLGLEHLSLYDRLAVADPADGWGMAAVHSWVLRRQGYWPRERAHLVATLKADAGVAP